MLALLAIIVLAPLLYLPGYCITRALLGAVQPPDILERHYERGVVGALLNGWLAFTLAELGIFSAWLHLLLVLLICVAAGAVAWRRGALWLPQAPLGIVARASSAVRQPERTRLSVVRSRLIANWDVAGFVVLGALFALLIGRPFEVVLGARDAGTYANTGIAIARTGAIVQHDELLQQIAADQSSADADLREAAKQAETNLLGSQPRTRFIATRLRVAGMLIHEGDLARGRVVPQGFHLYPAWIGLLASLLGIQGGLLATGLLGLLGVWSVGMLGRRLAGRSVGLLAALFLALNGVQVWFSRYSTSEACAQFLIFAGFYAFAVATTGNRPPTTDEHAGHIGGRWSVVGGRAGFAALIAGVAFGQVALVRIDFVLLLPPLIGYLLYLWLTRRWTRVQTWLAAGLAAMLLHAGLHIAFIARAYFFDTLFARLQDVSAIVATLSMPFLTPALQQIYLTTTRSVLRDPARLPVEIVLALAGCAALYLLRRYGRPLRWLEQTVLRYRTALLRISTIGIVLLGVYGYFIRPQILTGESLSAIPGCLSLAQIRGPAGECRALQGYIGASVVPAHHPNHIAYLLITFFDWLSGEGVPPRVSDAMLLDDKAGEIGIGQANMVRVGWYLSPLGVILGVAGFALWWRRGMSRASWMFLSVSLIVAIFFIRLSYGTESQTYIYILRRYIPLVYPAFSLGMAYALVALAGRTIDDRQPTTAARWQKLVVGGRWSVVGATVITVALIAFFVATNQPLYRHVEYEGALAQLSTVASRFGPRDLLLFRGEGRDTPDLMITPLKYAFGLDAFAIRSEDPGKYAAQLARYVQRWQSQGRQVYLVLGANGAVELPGLRATRVGPAALHLPEFQQLVDQKPRLPQAFDFEFVVYRLDPAGAAPAAPLAIAVDDYTAQVRGFYHPEQIGAARVAWTGGDALLRLPWPRDGAPLTLQVNLAGGKRPAGLGAARACLSFRPEPSFELADLPFSTPQCFTLAEELTGHSFTIDPRGQPAPATGTLLLRIASDTWSPADVDPAQHDRRRLGVQFGGLAED